MSWESFLLCPKSLLGSRRVELTFGMLCHFVKVDMLKVQPGAGRVLFSTLLV